MLNRRNLLAASAAAGALSLMPSSGVWAKSSLKLGAGTIDIVSDGHLSLPASMLLSRVDKAERDAWLKENPLNGDSFKSPLNLTLYRDGKNTVLFDVGSGPNFMSSAGKIAEALDAISVSPDEVTHVLFTHAHPDHIWGVKDDFDELVFANAAYHMSEAEWDYWFNPETVNKVSEDRQSFAVGARNAMKAIEDKVSRFKPGAEVVTGIESMDTSGHTPGHTSYVIHNGSNSLAVVGDVITNAKYSFSKPDWEMGTDSDPAKGVKSRKMLLERLAGDKAHMVGYHLPHPGTGFVEKAGAAYSYKAG